MSEARDLLFDVLAVDRASKVLDKVGDRAEEMGHRFGLAGKLASTAFTVAGTGLLALAGATVLGIKGAADYQKITAQTTAVLKSTHDASHETAEGIKELSEKISAYSGISRDTVQSGANMLLTFTNIRNGVGKNNKIFDQATKTLLDMSTALGEDPKNAAIQLGKALNDPVKGITALQRVGVTFTASQKNVIDKLSTTGHVAKAQKLILAELGREFGGSAKAAGSTFAGSLDKLKNAGMDLLENALTPILPVLAKWATWLANRLPKAFASLQKGGANAQGFFKTRLLPIFKDVASYIQTNVWPWLNNLAHIAFPAIVSAGKGVISSLEKHKQLFKNLGQILTAVVIPYVETLVTVLAKLAAVVLPKLVAAWDIQVSILQVVSGAFKLFIKGAINYMGDFIDMAASTFGWVPGLGPKLKSAAKSFDKFRDDVNNALNGIHNRQVYVKVNVKDPGSLGLGKLTASGRTAGGTNNWRGGWSRVGELGPEEVWMPFGSKVRTASQTREDSRGGGDTYNLNVAVAPGGEIAAAKAMQKMLLNLKRNNGGRALGIA